MMMRKTYVMQHEINKFKDLKNNKNEIQMYQIINLNMKRRWKLRRWNFAYIKK